MTQFYSQICQREDSVSKELKLSRKQLVDRLKVLKLEKLHGQSLESFIDVNFGERYLAVLSGNSRDDVEAIVEKEFLLPPNCAIEIPEAISDENVQKIYHDGFFEALASVAFSNLGGKGESCGG
jgi:hypothetical protein